METIMLGYMGGCQNYGLSLGTLNMRCRIIIGNQKGTIILTTIQLAHNLYRLERLQVLACDQGPVDGDMFCICLHSNTIRS